jgi:hypothetical protein
VGACWGKDHSLKVTPLRALNPKEREGMPSSPPQSKLAALRAGLERPGRGRPCSVRRGVIYGARFQKVPWKPVVQRRRRK